YVLGRIYQQQGRLEDARRSLDVAVMQTKSTAPLYEPLVRTQLADVIMAAGDEQAAIQELSQVIEYAPKSFRGFFALAAVHMRGNRPGPAFTVLRRTLDIDPRQDIERPSLTDFPLSPKELTEYAKAFADANVNETDEPLLRANEGVIRFHAGQRGKSRALFLDALQNDRYNHPALLYLSVLDYEEGRFAGIEKRLTQAERTTAGKHTITQLYLARAEMMGGEMESAEQRLRFIIDNEPTLLQARFTLGQLLLKRRSREEALALWQGVIVDAPDYLPVKRALAELKAGS
ncbi:MAG: tetratricopeptide repeat protein, partial [Myxococcota bacterium]